MSEQMSVCTNACARIIARKALSSRACGGLCLHALVVALILMLAGSCAHTQRAFTVTRTVALLATL
jgi:hypothetical protein